jgi:hypothetical protein
VHSALAVGRPFPWAAAGLAALPRLADAAGLRTIAVHRGQRRFAELTCDRATAPARGGGTGAGAVRIRPRGTTEGPR